MNDALGIIEIRGLATAIQVADTMAKTATVSLIEMEPAKGNGWMTIKATGNVAAVTASINSGKQIAESHGHFITSKVIPRPAENMANLFIKNTKQNGKPKVKDAEHNSKDVVVKSKKKIKTETEKKHKSESDQKIKTDKDQKNKTEENLEEKKFENTDNKPVNNIAKEITTKITKAQKTNNKKK